MKIKHLLLPLVAGLASYAMTATAQSAKTAQQMGGKSMTFIENKGQVTDQFHSPRMDIDFKLSGGNGLNIFFGKGKIHYQWAQRQKPEKPTDFMDRGTAEEIEKLYSQPVEMYRMDVELIGSNANAEVITEDQQPFFERYFLSWVNKDNSNEGVIANTYKKITYKNIYPHIDWIFYFNKKGQLEHDFVVHPGGKVADIQIKYSGSTNLKLNADGSLTAHSPMGIITENAPYSKEQSGREVASNFQLQNGILSFAVADYSGTLIIDPILEWGTYFGGSDDETSYALTTDKWGNVYMTGGTGSIANIVTTGAFQTTYGGGTSGNGGDAFLSKWNIDGDLLWATYYGGDKVDIGKGVGCDTLGNVYMGGYANSGIAISTIGSFQETKAGIASRYDAFLVKFDSSGQRDWGTYFGGAQNEASTSFSLTCDELDNIYITGNTQSNSEIATAGTHQTVYGGGQDGFVTTFNTVGNLVWATYFGGSSDDLPNDIVVDVIGNVYVVGNTKSTNGISSSGAYQINHAGNDDVFLCKLNANGQLEWATYFGGNNIDRGNAISMSNNKVFIGGQTNSSSGITTTSAHQSIKIDNSDDGFIAAYDLNGQLEWATYYGGESSETILGISCIGNDDLFISGQTGSQMGIATSGSYNEIQIGLSDVFLAKFNALGERQWGTYYGGVDFDNYGYLTTDLNHNIYLSGMTTSASNISTLNSQQNVLNGGHDAFLIRFNDCYIPTFSSMISGNIEVCESSIQIYSVVLDDNAESYTWILPNGWNGVSDSNSINITIGANAGELKVVAISECGGISDTQNLAIAVLATPSPIILNNNNILSTTQSYLNYQWNINGGAIPNATQSTFMAEENGNYSVTVTNNNDCENTSDRIEISDFVGMKDLEHKDNLKVYPNPVRELLNIESTQNGFAKLLSIEGKVLLSEIEIHSGTNTLSLKGLNRGMYFLKITNDKNQFQLMKIIKE